MKWLKGMKEVTVGLELFKLWRHPMTPAILILCFLLFSLLFYRLCVDYLQLAHAALNDRELATSLSQEVIKPFYSWSIIIFAMIIPLFTTAAFSQEYRQHTIILWATSAISVTDLILGKFFSQILLISILLGAMSTLLLSLHWETQLDWGMIVGAVLCVWLITACLVSFGLFISSIITSPLLAITLTFIGNLGWLLFEWLNPLSQLSWVLGKELSLLGHAPHLMHGIIYSSDIIFYLICMSFWLLMTSRVLQYRMQNLQ